MITHIKKINERVKEDKKLSKALGTKMVTVGQYEKPVRIITNIEESICKIFHIDRGY